VSFDPQRVELQWKDRRWQLVANGVVLKDFGHYESEGRQALRLVRELRLNSLGTVGAPRPILEYWLVNGEAPRGQPAGLRVVPLDTASVRAEPLQGQWCLRDDQRILFNFGQQADAARQAEGIIQRHGFTHIGYLGQASPVMLVFLTNPAPAVSGARVTPVRFPDPRLPGLLAQRRSASRPGETGGASAPGAPGMMPSLPSQPLPSGAPRPTTPGMMPVSLPQLPQLQQAGLPGSLVPGMANLGDRVPVDAQQVAVRQDGKDWKLVLGSHLIANFGQNRADAHLAQAALRYYRCTEQVLVGSPRPVFSYFLSNGQAPRGLMLGLKNVPFRPEALMVREHGGSWVLQDGSRAVLSFGDGREAQQVLQAIRQHRFDRLCQIGQGEQGMLLLVRSR
jgi:hypothetical protein